MELDESYFPLFGVLGGCAPAFAYMFIDSLARAGVKNGMKKDDALKIAFFVLSLCFRNTEKLKNAIDFLYKPFSYMRFEKAVNKAVELKTLQQLSATPVFSEESITLKVEYKNTTVWLKDILYIESMDNYIRVHLTDRTALMSQVSMKSIQELLPANRFIRIHKSYIVPAHRIASYNSKQITLYNGCCLPVGRSYSQELRKIK